MDDDDLQQQAQGSQLVQNQPHDEEVALSDSGSLDGGAQDASLIESHDMEEQSKRSISPGGYGKAQSSGLEAQRSEAMFPAASGTSDEAGAGGVGYNPREFKHLNVSDEIRDLFKHIDRYQPRTIDLDTKLKPFIPDYIPSVGGIDEFIKVPRPDGKPDFLGLKVLDEPAAKQTDPAVLTLQLRTLTKEVAGAKVETVGRVEHSDENKVTKISQWISSINGIHKKQPPATVNYSRRMPDIEALMQEWPPEMEAFLANMKMPSGELDLDLPTYTKLICSIFDVPVYDDPIQSLHLMFSLYLEFKSNPIFKQQLVVDHAYQSNGHMGAGAGQQGGGAGLAPSQWMGGATGAGAGANVMTFS